MTETLYRSPDNAVIVWRTASGKVAVRLETPAIINGQRTLIVEVSAEIERIEKAA